MSGSDIESRFPKLKSTGYKVTSPCDKRYNCFAWAAGVSESWWDPDPIFSYSFWPPGVTRAYSIPAYRVAYESLGYKECASLDLEHGFQKVVIFSKGDTPTHAARQLESGLWTSKLGPNVDITHELESLAGDLYGKVAYILKKPI